MGGKEIHHDVKGLSEQLRIAGLPVDRWGEVIDSQKTKTIADLMKEIEEGSCRLEEVGGEWIRMVEVVSVGVFYRDEQTGEVLELYEAGQMFADGDVRVRDMSKAMNEKMEPGESVKQAIKRGVRSELGIEGDLAVELDGMREEEKASPSYPELKSIYRFHEANLRLTSDQFNPEGYIEPQENKVTYFVWRRLGEEA